MDYLYKYAKFFETSQSKKIKKYFSYSVALDWYRINKGFIAQTIGCNVSDLASEETLMQQSYGLVNYVINPQTSGNTGRNDIEISGFSKFNKLDNNLIHDILHNLYEVKHKEFNKSLQDLEFTESEILEEIEVLAIEESFMKYMNITYVKTDFINQNINMLASYLMMAILKNDPVRIQKILDKEVGPYLEIYGKQYPVKDTPFENFFNLYDNRAADGSFRIYDAADFKNYMIRLINVGYGIDNTGGDRAQYPDGDYFGLESWYDLSGYDQKSFIEDNFERDRYADSTCYLITGCTTLNISEIGFDYTIVDETSNFESRDSLKSIPIKRELIDGEGDIDVDSWLAFIKQLYNIEIYQVAKTKYLGIEYYGKSKTYSIMDNEEFEDSIRDYFNDNADSNVATDTHFIDFDTYRQYPFEDLVEILMRSNDAKAIMRRNFRVNDVLKSNTKIGNLNYWSNRDSEVKTKNVAHRYIDFEGSSFASAKSISKIILTENGRKLKLLLDNLRGYVIKNLPEIKTDYQKNTQKFNQTHIEQFKKINIYELKALLKILSKINFADTDLKLDFELRFGYAGTTSNILKLLPDETIKGITQFSETFSKMAKFKGLTKTRRDVDYLRNFVNDRGLLQSPKDYSVFKGLITKIGKYSDLINKYKHRKTIESLMRSNAIQGIQIDKNVLTRIQKNIKNGVVNEKYNLNKALINILNKELPFLKFKSITVGEVDRFDIQFSIE